MIEIDGEEKALRDGTSFTTSSQMHIFIVYKISIGEKTNVLVQLVYNTLLL